MRALITYIGATQGRHLSGKVITWSTTVERFELNGDEGKYLNVPCVILQMKDNSVQVCPLKRQYFEAQITLIPESDDPS